MSITHTFTDRQFATIMAALYNWQVEGPVNMHIDPEARDIATGDGEFDALEPHEVQALRDSLQPTTGPADGEPSRDWLVQWETNAFDVDTPEEAAMQAWCQMRQRDHVPVFTVRDPEGAVHTVDMGG